MVKEWWFTGDALIVADGDAGVDIPNHLCVVQDHLLIQMVDEIRDAAGKTGDPDLALIAGRLPEDMKLFMDKPYMVSLFVDAAFSNPVYLDDWTQILEDHTQGYDLYKQCFSWDTEDDLIEYAEREWGWIRINNDLIAMWNRVPSRLRKMAMYLEEECHTPENVTLFFDSTDRHEDMPFEKLHTLY